MAGAAIDRPGLEPGPLVMGVQSVGRHVANLDRAVEFYKAIGFAHMRTDLERWGAENAESRLYATGAAWCRSASMTIKSAATGQPFEVLLREFGGISRSDWSGLPGDGHSWRIVNGETPEASGTETQMLIELIAFKEFPDRSHLIIREQVVLLVSLGKIVRFDPVKGCGFIRPDDGSVDVYVHADELGERLDDIAGTPVRFSSVQGAQWPKAYNVIILTRAFDEQDGLWMSVDPRYDWPAVANTRGTGDYHIEVQVLSDRDYMKRGHRCSFV